MASTMIQSHGGLRGASSLRSTHDGLAERRHGARLRSPEFSDEEDGDYEEDESDYAPPSYTNHFRPSYQAHPHVPYPPDFSYDKPHQNGHHSSSRPDSRGWPQSPDANRNTMAPLHMSGPGAGSSNHLRLPPLKAGFGSIAGAGSKGDDRLPPIYQQFVREFSGIPVSSASPSSMPMPPDDPLSVPPETCSELRRAGINPHWVVLPRLGDPCHFADKASCIRTDWRPAMWERHVQTHLPDSMKEFWECPHCLRPFNRKCAWVNHLRKTRTECGVRNTLESCDESEWKERWFHEPMPLRYPEEGPTRRKWHQYQVVSR